MGQEGQDAMNEAKLYAWDARKSSVSVHTELPEGERYKTTSKATSQTEKP